MEDIMINHKTYGKLRIRSLETAVAMGENNFSGKMIQALIDKIKEQDRIIKELSKTDQTIPVASDKLPARYKPQN